MNIMNPSYQSRTLPIGHTVVDNFSPSNRSVIYKHGKKWAYLRNPAGGIRRVSYATLEIMAYGI
jgi:hypothetical protein